MYPKTTALHRQTLCGGAALANRSVFEDSASEQISKCLRALTRFFSRKVFIILEHCSFLNTVSLCRLPGIPISRYPGIPTGIYGTFVHSLDFLPLVK